MASLDEFRYLQEQVEALTRRLDFMAPKLSLLNLTLQSSQRLESEASLQLTRLKSAKGVEDQGDISTLDSTDLAVWLQSVTDAVLGMLTGKTHACHDASGMRSGRQQERSVSPAPHMFSPRRELAFCCPRDASPRREAPVQPMDPGISRSQSPRSLLSPRGRKSDVQPVCPQSVPSLAMAAKAYRDVSPAGNWSVERRWPQVGELESTLGRQGLVLGKGAWAQAYRHANGTRREALCMLGTMGIVTEREFADDLTEIGQDHIEECIVIAAEMMEKWPPRHGLPPVEAAKKFFEERLTQLFLQRRPLEIGSE